MKNLVGRAAHRFLVPAGLSLLFGMNIQATTYKIVYDFQNTTNTTAWQVVNDDVMGGISTSTFGLTNGVALFHGRVSLENNGGFASVRSLPARHGLEGGDAFVVRVRGDGRSYKFTARMDPGFDGAIYQSVFTTKKGEWEEHSLPFKQFIPTYRGRVLTGQPPLDPVKVASLGFLISDKQEGPFQLEVAWIKVKSLPGR